MNYFASIISRSPTDVEISGITLHRPSSFADALSEIEKSGESAFLIVEGKNPLLYSEGALISFADGVLSKMLPAKKIYCVNEAPFPIACIPAIFGIDAASASNPVFLLDEHTLFPSPEDIENKGAKYAI